MGKHLTLEELRSALVDGSLEGPRRAVRAPRDFTAVDEEIEKHIRITRRGKEGRDAFWRFTHGQLKECGYPWGFEIKFPRNGHRDEIVLVLIHEPRDHKQHGVYQITRRNERRQGGAMLTWNRMRRRPPDDKGINGMIYLPIIILNKEFITVDVSSLELDDERSS